MTETKLTTNQHRVLDRFDNAGWKMSKNDFAGADWPRIDRLVTLGLVERQAWGLLVITPKGRSALSAGEG